MKTTTETRRAAKKKTMPQTNAVQSDPWLAWCEPAQGEDAQRFLDNPMERLGMSVDDHLALMEKFYPSEILHSAEHTISKTTSEAAIPKLEAIRVASTPDCEIDEDGTRTNDIPILAHTLTQQLPLFEIVEKVFSKLERIKEAWPHSAAVERLKKVAEDFVRLLLAVQRLGKEKIAQAKADGRIDAAAKLKKAYKDFCMIDLTGDIDKDAEQLFLVKKITPDAFRAAMRSAFKLDREATDEINGVGIPQQSSVPKHRHPGYEPGGMSQTAFAKLCGVAKRTVQNWDCGKTPPPTLFDETTRQMVKYSADLRLDPVKAQVFASNYKTHKRVKGGVRGAMQYCGEETDRVNERRRRGYTPSTTPRKADYEGKVDAKGIEGLRRTVWGKSSL